MVKNEGEEAQGGQGAEYDVAYEHAIAGRLMKAESVCRGILATDPNHAEALHLMGGIAAKSGKVPPAIEFFNRALKAKPDFTKAHNNLGTLLLGRGETDRAIVHFERAIAAEPGSSDAHNNLGSALIHAGRYQDAIGAFERAIAADPENVPAYNNLGVTLLQEARTDDAIARFNQAMELKPDLATTHANLARALTRKRDFEGAAAANRRALEIDPARAEVESSLGIVYRHLGRFDEALASQEKALEAKPDFARARFLRAVLLLAAGRFEEGFEAFLSRPLGAGGAGEADRRPLPSALDESDIFLRGEPDLEDEICFLRFAPELEDRGAWIDYQASARFAPLAGRLAFINTVVAENARPAAEDWFLLAGDLPFLLGVKTAAEFPPPLPLAPEPANVENMKARLRGLGPPPYVGLSWRKGAPGGTGIFYKFAPIDGLAKGLSQVPGTFLALQSGPRAGEIDRLSAGLGRAVHDLGALNGTVEDMLATLSVIDEYVAVGNVNVHLRAGAGRASRILVPHPADYKCMNEGAESPWFPGSRLYRQAVDGDWRAAFDALASDLVADLPPAS
ncbi:MAG: tetratricopeptide repeat protein [Proteobacteria bacterium]|nr:tetratricopeptide repeat protein [Pseudomonadota bacterium]